MPLNLIDKAKAKTNLLLIPEMCRIDFRVITKVFMHLIEKSPKKINSIKTYDIQGIIASWCLNRDKIKEY